MNEEPQINETLVLETIEASFALLELSLEKLAAIAPVTRPEQILELLPSAALHSAKLVVVELIKFDLSAAAEAGELRRLEFYWPVMGRALPQEQIPFDLVLEEVQLLRGAGENPRWEDYRQRFPDLAATIGKWLAGDQPEAFQGATSAVPELQINTLVDDFFVLKQLGQGAFARVYLARQESMQRLVALKATKRGSEEPQALSQLDHPNIVRVYDQREIAEPKTILLYMQYLAGGTLADCIKRLRTTDSKERSGQLVLESIDQNLLSASQSVPEQSPIRTQVSQLPWPELVAWIGIQLADGLGYATRKGIIHRDIKPANILLSAEAIPKLVDFNVSCSGLSGRAGAAAYFGGSLAYMSPEQLQVADPTVRKPATELDGRSDLYALGIVLWELWQGKRPWASQQVAGSWTEAVSIQRSVRNETFATVTPALSATERVLEKVLRRLLAIEPEDRPGSGSEVAGRLRLAFYPDLAQRFEPDPSSVAGRLFNASVLLIGGVLIFGPNTAASVFNYFYNQSRMQELQPLIPKIAEDFEFVAGLVNGIVFPLGGILFWMVMRPIVRIVHQARKGLPASPKDITTLLNIGNLATIVCGILWTVSGVVFATTFASMHSEFGGADAFHFFISLVLCGGVAWVYPYFGMTLLALLIYYPQAIAPTMNDPEFDQRCQRIRNHSRWYLLSAAAIPLTAVALLVLRAEIPRQTLVAGCCITGVGLLASFFAFQKLEQTMQQLSKVLGDHKRSVW
ncbi:serine/threonine-protein kinase [Aureliella helgolandensis]|uniref:Serine/threonine-protein kinase PrkC n=1 Tax=Aureliella helgolandensis TaxID=2527968 RepID=A0A518G0R7_9BACT|nr:serine/threonine-protein kinase [Aureliella helgolandensis]QDV22130.1 Serine/threonine-protein kinase PrkC [Aureliella helgolandensis]